MSTFSQELVSCPHCGLQVICSVAYSINASRSPQYKASIVEETFQAHCCSSCKHEYTIESQFIYVDHVEKIWIGVLPEKEANNWKQLENSSLSAFEKACGTHSPPVAQEIGKGMVIRTVFGLQALREKILCFQSGINDTLLEALKFRLAISSDLLNFDPSLTIRLFEISDSELIFLVLGEQATSQSSIEKICVDKQLYTDIMSNQLLWQNFIDRISNSPYHDIGKLLCA